MKKKKSPIKETLVLALGEIIVSLLVVGGFLILGLSEKVPTISVIVGVSVGSAVIVLNYLFLQLTVNRLIDGYLELRGTKEMTPEQILEFTTQHSMRIQNAIKLSFIIRIGSMLGALVVSFIITDYIHPLATVIPIIAYRPILSIRESIRRKLSPAPNPENFIIYDNNEDGFVEVDENEAGADDDADIDSSTAPLASASGAENADASASESITVSQDADQNLQAKEGDQ